MKWFRLPLHMEPLCHGMGSNSGYPVVVLPFAYADGEISRSGCFDPAKEATLSSINTSFGYTLIQRSTS
jgi:hypothetical protein